MRAHNGYKRTSSPASEPDTTRGKDMAVINAIFYGIFGIYFAIGEFIGDHEDFFESPAGMAATTVCAIAAMALVGTIDYETGARY